MIEVQWQSLRRAVPEDVPALAALYAQTARTLGPGCYTVQQVQAWESFAHDTSFGEYVLGACTWVLVDTEAQPCAFCGVDDGGEVRSFYVRAGCTRRGIGSRLLAWVLQDARARGHQRFSTWATPISRRVFERAGFVLQQVVREPYQGVLFDRFRLVLPAAGECVP